MQKILVIEDEKVSLALVKFGLAAQCYDVVAVRSAEKGLEKIKADFPDLIILDVMLPGISGYQFITELKEIPDADQIPIIVLTGKEEMEEAFKMMGVKGYFIKPIKIPELVEKIEGAEMTCKSCDSDLVCHMSKYEGGFENKLQWQNSDGSAHYKWKSAGKYDCVIPGENNISVDQLQTLFIEYLEGFVTIFQLAPRRLT